MKFTPTRETVKMFEVIERSPAVRRLLYAAEAVAALYTVAPILHAIQGFFK